MPSNQQQALLDCDCGCEADGCPCCPGWPLERSAGIHFTSIEESYNDCTGTPFEVWEYSDTFSCTGLLAFPFYQRGIGTGYIYCRIRCNPETLEWIVEYKSPATGMTDNDPETGTWVPVVFDFTCPDCADAIDGVAYGTFDFVAVTQCEISGPTIITFNVLVHADVEVQCV